MRTFCAAWDNFQMKPLLFLLLAVCSVGTSAHPGDEQLDGPQSVYTEWLAKVLKSWPVKRSVLDSATPLELTCIGTPNEEKYIGMLQHTTISAHLSAVEKVLDDVAHYKDLFPGIVDVRVVPGSQDGKRFATAWEQRVPVPFLPNVTYELSHLVDKSSPGLVIYRYKLRRGDKMLASDGMVVLEALGPETTRFTEYDFFNAQWGVLPAAVVWRESLRGAFLSDVAIKLKAENPGWSYERVTSEAERLIAPESERITRCIKERQNADLREPS